MSPIDRRRFLAATGAGVAAAALSTRTAAAEEQARQAELAARTGQAGLFGLGVASGDATWSGIVLWTRLVPAPLAPDSGFGMGGAGPQTVHWRIGRSEDGVASGDRIDQAGSVTAVGEQGFAVHVDVKDLRPGTIYYYRFAVGDQLSPVGRTRTAPAPGTLAPLRFAVINCQNLAGTDRDGQPTPLYQHGLDHLATRDDIDFVLYLGDYIYEFGRSAHIPPRAVHSLDEYRTRYGQYKSLPGLQEVHRRFPVYAVPDDHEYFNDVHGGALADGQITRFNNGVEAFWEHLPVRSRPTDRPGGNGVRELINYRQIRWGRLLDLFMIDVRHYATPTDALGPKQWNEFITWLGDSEATWTSVGSGFGWAYYGPGGVGAWAGYTEQRAVVTDLLARRKAADPGGFNPVLVSGDIHCGMITHVRQAVDLTSPLVATELVNAPMGSGTTRFLDPSIDPEALRRAYNKGAEGGWNTYRGYLTNTITADAWTADYYLTDDYLEPVGQVAHGGRWRLAAGAPVGSIEELPLA